MIAREPNQKPISSSQSEGDDRKLQASELGLSMVSLSSSGEVALTRAIGYLEHGVRPHLYRFLLALADIQKTEGAVSAHRFAGSLKGPVSFMLSEKSFDYGTGILTRTRGQKGCAYELTELGLKAIRILEAQRRGEVGLVMCITPKSSGQ